MAFSESALIALVGLFLVVIVVILIALIIQSYYTVQSEITLLDVNGVTTDRNGLSTLDYIVNYRATSLDPDTMPDANAIKTTIAEGLMMSASLPADSTWGQVNKTIVNNIFKSQNVSGVSLQLMLSTEQSNVFTRGNVAPLDKRSS